MFNHLSDARAAALDLLAAFLGEERPKPDAALPAPTWLGSYLEPETGLAVRIAAASAGQIKLRYGHSQEELNLQADGSASNASGTCLSFSDAGLRMNRPQENQSSQLRSCEGAPTTDVAGRYRCGELDAELTVADAGGVVYGGFSGFLGQGRMEMLEPVGPDVWTLPCYRALDHTPPGDWTLAFRRDQAGRVEGVDVGCWLARRIPYERVAGR
jgi:D-aminopeptidase